METVVRDVSTRWFAAVGTALSLAGMFCTPQAQLTGLLLMATGLVVWASAMHRSRWVPAVAGGDTRLNIHGRQTDLTTAASLGITYRENGASLAIRWRDRERQTLEWRDTDALDQLVAAGRLVPQVARFELRRASYGRWIALALASAFTWIFVLIIWLPIAEPILLAMPWFALLSLAALAACLVPLRWLQATVTIDGPHLSIRSGWSTRTVRFDEVQAVAVTHDGLSIQLRGLPTVRLATPSSNTVKRFVRIFGSSRGFVGA
jgi:hypothetical protein